MTSVQEGGNSRDSGPSAHRLLRWVHPPAAYAPRSPRRAERPRHFPSCGPGRSEVVHATLESAVLSGGVRSAWPRSATRHQAAAMGEVIAAE